MRAVEIFDDGERLAEPRVAVLEERYESLRILGEVTGVVLVTAQEVDEDLFGLEPLEVERDPDAVRRAAPEIRVDPHPPPPRAVPAPPTGTRISYAVRLLTEPAGGSAGSSTG